MSEHIKTTETKEDKKRKKRAAFNVDADDNAPDKSAESRSSIVNAELSRHEIKKKKKTQSSRHFEQGLSHEAAKDEKTDDNREKKSEAEEPASLRSDTDKQEHQNDTVNQAPDDTEAPDQINDVQEARAHGLKEETDTAQQDEKADQNDTGHETVELTDEELRKFQEIVQAEREKVEEADEIVEGYFERLDDGESPRDAVEEMKQIHELDQLEAELNDYLASQPELVKILDERARDVGDALDDNETTMSSFAADVLNELEQRSPETVFDDLESSNSAESAEDANDEKSPEKLDTAEESNDKTRQTNPELETSDGHSSAEQLDTSDGQDSEQDPSTQNSQVVNTNRSSGSGGQSSQMNQSHMPTPVIVPPNPPNIPNSGGGWGSNPNLPPSYTPNTAHSPGSAQEKEATAAKSLPPVCWLEL